MPIYEYHCEGCNRTIEAIQRFSDAPLTSCDHCAGRLHKIISQSSFHLKGSGWYVTDYANKPKGTPDSDAATPKEDTKPAAAANTDKSD